MCLTRASTGRVSGYMKLLGTTLGVGEHSPLVLTELALGSPGLCGGQNCLVLRLLGTQEPIDGAEELSGGLRATSSGRRGKEGSSSWRLQGGESLTC